MVRLELGMPHLMARTGMLMRSQASALRSSLPREYCFKDHAKRAPVVCLRVWMFVLNVLVYNVALVDGGNAGLSIPLVRSCASASAAPGLLLWCHTCIEL